MIVWSKIVEELCHQVEGTPEQLTVPNDMAQSPHLAELAGHVQLGLCETWDSVFRALKLSDVTPHLAQDLAAAIAVARQFQNPGTLGSLTDIQAAAAGFLEATSAAALARFRALLHTLALGPEQRNQDTSERVSELICAARIWTTLAPSSDLGEELNSSTLPPWLARRLAERKSQDRTNEDRAVEQAYRRIALQEAIPAQCRSIHFPITLGEGDTARGFVVHAKVHLMIRQIEGHPGPSSQDSAALNDQFDKLPVCGPVPWSPLNLTPEIHDRLTRLLGLKQLRVRSDARVMYELWPAEHQSPFLKDTDLCPATTIDGESLTLGMTLAMWAASQGCELRPLVVSAAVDRNGSTQGVKGVVAKATAIADWIQNCKRPVQCLLVHPKPEESQALTTLVGPFRANELFGQLPVAEWKGLKVIQAPLTIDELLQSQLRLALLTDGFDTLRGALGTVVQVRPGGIDLGEDVVDAIGRYLPEDGMCLDNLIHRFTPQLTASPRANVVHDTANDTVPTSSPAAANELFESIVRDVGGVTILPLPFANDPLPAVRYVVANLIHNQKDAADHAGRSRADDRMLLPLLLTADTRQGDVTSSPPDDPAEISLSDFVRMAAERVRDTVMSLTGLSVLPDWETCQQAISNALIRGGAANVVFLTFSQESYRVDYDHEHRFLERLLERLRKSAPGENLSETMLVIASDLHHARFLEAVLTGTVPNDATVAGTAAGKSTGD